LNKLGKIVSKNLKQIRQQKGLSLKEIAENIGVSTSFLSQVENNKTIPSLSTLKSIADYMNITISELLGEKKDNFNPVLRFNDRKNIHYADGITMCLLTYPDPNKQMEPLYFEMNPEASSGTKMYRHFGQEFVLVLEGILEIKLNDQKYILKKGDSIYFNSSIPHSFKNLDKNTTKAIWVDTPPSF